MKPKPLPPSRTADQFVLRFPEGMRERVAEEAKRNGRSMNSELIARLEQSFAPNHGAAALDAGQFLIASLLRQVYEDLPKSKQGESRHRLAYQLASAVIHKDPLAMAEAFAGLFAGDPDVVRAMQEVKSDFLPGGRFADIHKPN